MRQNKAVRDNVRDYLTKQLEQGEIQLDKTINLARLGRQLGVSVTPIREALTQLEHVGIVKSLPNRGFVVADLKIAEAKDLYKTVADLQVLALENCEIGALDIPKLKKQLLTLQRAHTISQRLKEHFNFHRMLTSNASPLILDILKNLWIRILFYEQHYITDAAFYENVDNQNEAIIQAIEDDNLPTALLILKMNWLQTLDHLVAQMILNQNVHFDDLSQHENKVEQQIDILDVFTP